MNQQPKPLASLSSTLLARKGSARPAMRPQGFGGFGTIPNVQDDLGWNDMGEVESQPVAPMAETPMPPVLIQREALHEEFAEPVVNETPDVAIEPIEIVAPEEPAADVTPAAPSHYVSVATATRIRRETRARHKSQAKSAFTLRLDADRHLRLRLASALSNQSAQLIVTAALDAFLENMPDVERLIGQLPTRAVR